MEKKYIYQLGDRTYNSKESLDLGIKRHGHYNKTYDTYELVETKSVKSREEELMGIVKQNSRDLKVKGLLGELSKSEQKELDLEDNCIKLYRKYTENTELYFSNIILNSPNNMSNNYLEQKFKFFLKGLKEMVDRENFKGFKKIICKYHELTFLLSNDVDYLTLLLRVHNFKSIPRFVKMDRFHQPFKKAKELRLGKELR